MIELIIAVAIVAILAGVALPSYLEHVRKSRRALATACLQALAQQMERRYTVNMSYLTAAPGGAGAKPEVVPTANCVTDTAAFYAFSFAAKEPTADTFVLQAEPVGAQAADASVCGTLTLDHQGVRGAKVNSCWP